MKEIISDMLAEPFLNLKKKMVKKGTLLLLSGQYARYAYYVTKGCLRSYVVDDTGKQHILQFAPEGWYISDMNSLLNCQKAVINIDAIEDSEFFVYDSALMRSTEGMPSVVLTKGIKILQNSIIASNKRLIHLLSSTAEERYLDFINTYPALATRLPLKHIGAYLGITPEVVSRIRKKIVHK